MKNLLLLLILANILYLMWGMFATEDARPGVVVIEEADLGPVLEVTVGQDTGSIASVGAVLGSGDPSDLEALVGRSCVTVGPFWNRDDADTAENIKKIAEKPFSCLLKSMQAWFFAVPYHRKKYIDMTCFVNLQYLSIKMHLKQSKDTGQDLFQLHLG